jgi:hypothetical protein
MKEHEMSDPHATDRRAIEELKHRYARAVDTRDWAAMRATLAPEMTAHYRADLVTEGADALVAELRQRLTDDRVTSHQLLHPSIDIDRVDGDTAQATWTMSDRTFCTDIGLLVEGQSLSHDCYRRDPERGWLVTSIRYQRVFECRMPLPEGFAMPVTPSGLAVEQGTRA